MQLINLITSAVSLSLISAQANFPNVMQSCQTMGYCNNGNDDQCNACQLNLGYINQAYNQANGFQQGQSGYIDPQIPTASPVAPTTVATSAPQTSQDNNTTGNSSATSASSGEQPSSSATQSSDATQSQATSTDASQTQTTSGEQTQQTSTSADASATTTASGSQTAATSTTTRSNNSSSTTTAGNNANKIGGSIILGAVGLIASFLY
jgi:hypothetical protein